MRRPSLQFYPADWRANANLRRCSFSERGIWLEVMCLMHDSDEYGVLRWPLSDIAQAIGCRIAGLRALRAKEVLKGADLSERCAPFVYRPRHAGQEGESVVLIAEQDGPIWYSSRMIRDEYVRSKRGEGTRFGDASKSTSMTPPTRREGDSPKVSPIRREGDGPSSSTSINSKEAAGAAPDSVWNEGLSVLTSTGTKEAQARTFIGKLLREWQRDDVLDALREAKGKADPRGYVWKLLSGKPKKAERTSPFMGAI